MLKKINSVCLDFVKNEEGIGVVEIILILVILIALVILFKKDIDKIVKNALNQISKDSSTIVGN